MDLYSLFLASSLFLAAIILQSLGLWIASRMMRLPETGYKRALTVAFLTTSFSVLVSSSSQPVSADPFAVALTAVVAYLLPIFFYRRYLRINLALTISKIIFTAEIIK